MLLNPWEGFALAFAITIGIAAALALVLLILLAFALVIGLVSRRDHDFIGEEDTRPYPTASVELNSKPATSTAVDAAELVS